jgi:hypothetical protein
MKKLVQIAVVVLVVIFSFESLVFSQACGEGELYFEFYVLNGEKIENLQYEVISVSEEAIEKVFTKYQFDVLHANMYFGSVINEEDAEKIISLQKDTNLDGLLTNSELDNSGTISGGIITFMTFETLNSRYLLKITYDTKTVYILANLFGGCDRTSKVLFSWRNKPIIVPQY